MGLSKEEEELKKRFSYCACEYCDEGARWECRECGLHFCADCSEKHTKKRCKEGD